MAIHWQLKFRSLRADILYSVNIYDAEYSGAPVQLQRGTSPIVIEESADDDVFAPLRTQSGYIRVVDDDTINWRDLIPQTDTDRPVTLTHEENNATVVDWQGYMQAQNFSGKLYEPTQERDFPVQCAITTLSRLDASPTAFAGELNFAAAIDHILQQMPTLSWSTIVVQGGADARTWLMKMFDWSLVAEMDNDNEYVGKYNMMEILENICRYWGWTLRTNGQTIFLMAPDDTTCVNFLVLTRAQLTTLAGGTSTGTITTGGWTTDTLTNQLASVDNLDSQMRGANKATLTAEVGMSGEGTLIECYPDPVSKAMNDGGYVEVVTNKLWFSVDKTSFETPLIIGSANSASDGSYNIMRTANDGNPTTYLPVVRCKTAYDTSVKAAIYTKIAHPFSDGELVLKGVAYHNGGQFSSTDDPFPFGNKHMMMQIGVGATLQTAKWWNGDAWVNSQTSCYVKVGGTDGYLYTTPSKTWQGTDHVHKSIPMSKMTGKVFIHFMGCDEKLSTDFTDYGVDVANFAVIYQRPDDDWRFINPARDTQHEYKAKNQNVVKQDWTAGCFFATDNYLAYGPGLVMNTDLSYFGGWNYPNHQAGTTQPEQHLVDRVAQFWSKSRRLVECDVRYDLLSGINPQHKVSFDSMTFYPVAMNYDWWNDVVRLLMIEL